MRKTIEDVDKKVSFKELFRRGFFSGIGWAFGATVGFAVISTVLVVTLRSLGGLPFVGNIIASVVQATLDQLVNKSPVFN